jgi:murein DD-endopeptidase MepM/ murein hydrolase activator NlpD
VELAGWFDIYGNCIILRHSNGYKTLYGHMNAYGKGIKKGVRVKQGQIIGYIGTTGMSTGPHLHYEVIFNDVKINPASVKSPPERNLTKNELERFNRRKAQVDELFENLKKKD